MKKILTATLPIIAIASAHAQTNFSASMFELKATSYAVVNVDVSLIFQRGNLSSSWQGFSGSSTDGRFVAGTDIDLAYEFAPNSRAFVFVGAPIPIQGFSLDKAINAGFGVGLGYQWRFTFGPSPKAQAKKG